VLHNGIFYDCFTATLEKVKRITQYETIRKKIFIKNTSLFFYGKVGSEKARKMI
jgi:hypothetical protein